MYKRPPNSDMNSFIFKYHLLYPVLFQPICDNLATKFFLNEIYINVLYPCTMQRTADILNQSMTS